ncbi:MAG: ABC transporter permease [Actinomycetota bacterium]
MNVEPSHEPRPTDRGSWRLVAARDFSVRLRDKGFFISTAITLTVLSVFILLRAFGGDAAPSFRLGLGGPLVQAIDGSIDYEGAGTRRGIEIEVVAFDDEEAARAALRAGDIDAVVVRGGVELLGVSSVPTQLTQVVQDSLVRGRIASALGEAGVPQERIDALLNQQAITIRTLEPQDPNRDENAGIAFVAVLLAYGQLFGYGVWVATGVIEEKASRVVEILLSAIRPRQLLAGKIAGIGLLGIVQLAFIATFAIGLSLATGALELPSTAVGIALVVLVWFVMGFAFYAGLFAVSGSLVSRMEELQNALVPINLTIFVSFFISLGALEDPDSTLSVVASVLPFSSALAMPVRIALGSATAAQIVLSVSLLVAGTGVLVPLSARLYAGAVLKTGSRVKLREAWRSAASNGGATADA